MPKCTPGFNTLVAARGGMGVSSDSPKKTPKAPPKPASKGGKYPK